jgi:hypothetical protein
MGGVLFAVNGPLDVLALICFLAAGICVGGSWGSNQTSAQLDQHKQGTGGAEPQLVELLYDFHDPFDWQLSTVTVAIG